MPLLPLFHFLLFSVLPHYAPVKTDEFCSEEGQLIKFKIGELEELKKFKETDCSKVFGENNVDVGGLAIALPHGSLMFECAKLEVHATTALDEPNRTNPSGLGKLVLPVLVIAMYYQASSSQ